jgi:rhodopsin domain-containing protein
MVERWQKRTVYVLVALSTLMGTGYFLFAVFQCGVPGEGKAFWQKKIGGQCDKQQDNSGVGYAHAILNAVTDILLAAIPIPMIRKSLIKPKEKRIVYFILVLATM